MIPGVDLLRGYRRSWLRGDLVAGLTVAAYLVPQVMAYASVAGLPPVAGLRAALPALVVYFALGSSRSVSMGPEATTALMTAIAIGPLAAGEPARYAALASSLALLTGLMATAAGLLRLGFVADLLSRPVLVGYMAGVALIMIAGQLGRVTGAPVTGHEAADQVRSFASGIGQIHPATIAVAAGVLGFLYAVRARWPRAPMITHGMHLAKPERAAAFAQAGIHDFLVSIHGLGGTVAAIHGRGRNNAARQMEALDNLRALGVPFRFNVTMIRDNLAQLEAIARLAREKGARVVNFLTFNPYFEWERDIEVTFQARHSEIAPYLMRAIDICTACGIEANVRYMPPCQLPGYEQHVYTGFQLPYDPHEWDYNSWYDTGHEGTPSAAWYNEASRRQRERHNYRHVPACSECAIREICDGFHAQYAARWGGTEAVPYPGPMVTDPCHFVRHQDKHDYAASEPAPAAGSDLPRRTDDMHPAAAQLDLSAGGGAGARHSRPARR